MFSQNAQMKKFDLTLLLVPTIGSWAQVWSQAGLPEEQQTDSALGSILSLKQDMMKRNCLSKLTLPSRQGDMLS